MKTDQNLGLPILLCQIHFLLYICKLSGAISFYVAYQNAIKHIYTHLNVTDKFWRADSLKLFGTLRCFELIDVNFGISSNYIFRTSDTNHI